MHRILFMLYLLHLFLNVNFLYSRDLVKHPTQRRVINVLREVDLFEIMGTNIENTHYVIRYNHDLSKNNKDLVIGNNCILEFKSGSIIGAKIKSRNIVIKGRKPKFTNSYIVIEKADAVILSNIKADFTFAEDDFIRICDSENIYIDNVSVVFDKDNKQFKSGVYIEAEGFDISNCSNVHFEKCSISNSKSHYADSKHGSLICKNSNNITVNACYSTGGHNEILNFIDCHNVTITNTVVEGGDGSAIATQGGNGFVIDHCKSYNVGASAYSFNSREVRITNCLAKDWHRFNGITLGHSDSNLRASGIVASNCRIILSRKNDSQKKCAFGGVINGSVNINNCRSKTSRICNFDAVFESEIVSLTLDNNYFEVFEGDAFSEIFRTSDVLNLTVINNTFDGNACINGYIREYDGVPASNWIIRGNVFKHLKQAPVIHPNVKKNTSNGTFDFSDNVIERTDASILRYYYLEEKSTVDFISLPHYSHRIVSNNKIRKLKGNVRLFGTEQSDGIETVFTGNSLDGKGVDLENNLNY